jgi:hypothetical protein
MQSIPARSVLTGIAQNGAIAVSDFIACLLGADPQIPIQFAVLYALRVCGPIPLNYPLFPVLIRLPIVRASRCL